MLPIPWDKETGRVDPDDGRTYNRTAQGRDREARCRWSDRTGAPESRRRRRLCTGAPSPWKPGRRGSLDASSRGRHTAARPPPAHRFATAGGIFGGQFRGRMPKRPVPGRPLACRSHPPSKLRGVPPRGAVPVPGLRGRSAQASEAILHGLRQPWPFTPVLVVRGCAARVRLDSGSISHG